METKDKGCAVCGGPKKFEKSPTCSRECANVIKRSKAYENRTCPVCETVFEERIKRERKFCSEPCRLDWQARPENIAARMERTKEAVMEKYGVDSSFKVKEVQGRAADNMRKALAEHGDERNAKIKNTKQRRYGNENYNNTEKNRETKLENHGDENYNNRDKAEKTMLNLYGETHAMKRVDFQEKAKATLMENYGVSVPLNHPDVKKKALETNRDRYGADTASQVEWIKEKVSKTWLDNLDKTKMYEVVQDLKAHDIKLLDDFIGFKSPIYKAHRLIVYNFQCIKCEHTFKRTFCSYSIPVCRRCTPVPSNPKTHQLIREFLVENKMVFSENDRRFLQNRMELDFLLEEKKVAIEINGNYFHSEAGGGKAWDYHINKTKLCHEKGIRLVHVFEDEVMDRPQNMISRLGFLLGVNSGISINGRSCVVEVVSNKDMKGEFYEENHMQGTCGSSIDLGLVHENVLVSMMSFSKPRIALGMKNDGNGSMELTRFCNKNGVNVRGAFSKLFSYFKNNYQVRSVVTFADIRWSGYDPDKTVYAKNGFSFEGYSKPNYWYFERNDYLTRHHRFRFRKDVVSNLALNEGLCPTKEDAETHTEWELAQLLGMDRIWDCGNMKFLWKRPE